MAGGHIAIMARVLAKYFDQATIFAFDSFEGIPQATDQDTELCRTTYGRRGPGEPIKSSGISHVDVPGFEYFLRCWGVTNRHQIVVCKGWFEETMADQAKAITSIALLRIDVDLHSSVKTVLENMYPKVVSGGVVIFDDWGLEDDPEPPCRRALREYLGTLPQVTAVEGNQGTVFWRKP